MRLFVFLIALGAFGQSNQVQLCDQATAANCITWTPGPTLAANFTMTGPTANAAGPLCNDGSGNIEFGSCSASSVTNGFFVTGKSTVSPPSTAQGLQSYYDPAFYSAYWKVYDNVGALGGFNLYGSVVALQSDVTSFGVQDNSVLPLVNQGSAYVSNGDLRIAGGTASDVLKFQYTASGTHRAIVWTNGGGTVVNRIESDATNLIIKGGIIPDTAGGYDLGSSSYEWGNGYFGSVQVTTKVIPSTSGGGSLGDSSHHFGNAYIDNLTISSCTGCGSGTGSYLPLAGGTMSGIAVFDAALGGGIELERATRTDAHYINWTVGGSAVVNGSWLMGVGPGSGIQSAWRLDHNGTDVITVAENGDTTFYGNINFTADNTVNIGAVGNRVQRVYTMGWTSYGSDYVASGSTLNVQSGGTLALAAGSTFTVDASPAIGAGYNITMARTNDADAQQIVWNGPASTDWALGTTAGGGGQSLFSLLFNASVLASWTEGGTFSNAGNVSIGGTTASTGRISANGGITIGGGTSSYLTSGSTFVAQAGSTFQFAISPEILAGSTLTLTRTNDADAQQIAWNGPGSTDWRVGTTGSSTFDVLFNATSVASWTQAGAFSNPGNALIGGTLASTGRISANGGITITGGTTSYVNSGSTLSVQSGASLVLAAGSTMTSSTSTFTLDSSGNMAIAGYFNPVGGIASSLIPITTNVYSLGSPTRYWNTAYIHGGTYDSLAVNGNLGVSGGALTTTFNSAVFAAASFSNSSGGDALQVFGPAAFSGNIRYAADNTVNIGTSSNRAQRIYTMGWSSYGSNYVSNGSTLNVQNGGTFSINSGATVTAPTGAVYDGTYTCSTGVKSITVSQGFITGHTCI